MFPNTKESQLSLITFLQQFDCCSRCILRYIGIKISNSCDPYLNPDSFLLEYSNDIQVHSKRLKKNPCRVCLNVLEDSTIQRYADNLSEADAQVYKYKDFMQSVNIPKTLNIRDYSMLLHIKKEFPDYNVSVDDLQSIKCVFRIVAGEVFGVKMKKCPSTRSALSLIVDILYEDDEREVENIKRIGINKQKYNTSKSTICTVLKECDEKSFRAFFSVPPDIPMKETTAHMSFHADVIYLGGRYLKFSRNMGQTPWTVNNQVLSKYCLMDILFDSVEKILGYERKKMTFSASGREDMDVRMLGTGRPFCIQIDDAKDPAITFEQCRAIEKDILQSKLAAVIKLQKIENADVKAIKTAEEFKKKHYYSLCHTTAPDVQEVVDKINMYNNVAIEIAQITPLRVLHRRTLSSRTKTIYSMEASTIPGHNNVFYLRLITQAGTYVKEFVHGDFHRTEPSLTTLMKHNIDIVALDVTKVDVDFPF